MTGMMLILIVAVLFLAAGLFGIGWLVVTAWRLADEQAEPSSVDDGVRPDAQVLPFAERRARADTRPRLTGVTGVSTVRPPNSHDDRGDLNAWNRLR